MHSLRPVAFRAATYEASPNIALVKYWGLRDEARRLPYNSSLSVTLAGLTTRTTVRFGPDLTEDGFRLNGRPAAPRADGAVKRFLERIRQERGIEARAAVESRNNFPTATGLASSASGFAALAGAASRAAGLSETPAALSYRARFGSGSACRSIYGGYVEWQAGRRPDGRDCYAKSLFGPRFWPELVDLVVLVRDAPVKEIRSQEAMQLTVATSPDYRARLRAIPRRIAAIRRAIRLRRAAALFATTMEECDDFRHVCETTDPPLDYLTATSHQILEEVRALNAMEDRIVAGYTHDAGAHVHVFTVRSDLSRVRAALRPVRGIQRMLLLTPGPGGRYRAGPKGRAMERGRPARPDD